MSDKIVYSTELGDLRKDKSKGEQQAAKKSDSSIRVQRESKGHGGKTVSVIYGLPLHETQMADLAAKLKQKCGSGGTAKDGVIIIQGDKVDLIIQILQKEGYTAKRSGG